MIFLCVGSREYPFDRLLKEMDRLVVCGDITQVVFAQIGGSTYIPQHYEYERFLGKEQFDKLQDEAELIISHAGSGALIGALKKGKRVIAVPRLAKYGEHIDDHQTQIAEVLADEGYLLQVIEIERMGPTILESLQIKPKTWQKESNVLKLISDFTASVLRDGGVHI